LSGATFCDISSLGNNSETRIEKFVKSNTLAYIVKGCKECREKVLYDLSLMQMVVMNE
jgi:hypothetical protein